MELLANGDGAGYRPGHARFIVDVRLDFEQSRHRFNSFKSDRDVRRDRVEQPRQRYREGEAKNGSDLLLRPVDGRKG